MTAAEWAVIVPAIVALAGAAAAWLRAQAAHTRIDLQQTQIRAMRGQMLPTAPSTVYDPTADPKPPA